MKMKMIGVKQYEGTLSGTRWMIRPSNRDRGSYAVFFQEREAPTRYYEKTHKTIREAKKYIALLYTRDRLRWVIEHDSAAERFNDGTLGDGSDPATVMAFVDYCQENDLWKYLRPVIREGNRAGLLWPGAWAAVAKGLRKECAR